MDLINVKNEEAVTTSLLIAEHFGKKHKHVIEKIEKIIIDDSTEKSAQCFKKGSYKDESGKTNKMYYINRDGFTFLVMGFTGKKASEWKWKYIEAFNKMESLLSEKKTNEWVETRKQGKITRKAETDIIQQLIGYAKAQGSTHSEMLYMTYSKLANKIAGIKDRNLATLHQLNSLDFIERIILFEIENGMNNELDYHEIYQHCKVQVEHFSKFTYLNKPLPVRKSLGVV